MRNRTSALVKRLGKRVIGDWRPGRAAPPPAPRSRADRVAEALDVVRRIEEVEPTLPAPTDLATFHTIDRVVRRPLLDPALMTMMPKSLRGTWAEGRGFEQTSAAIAADVIVLAKFDLGEQVKLRAGYGQARRSLAVQPVGPDGICGVTNSVRAHEVVSRYAPELMPTMLGHGELDDGLRYLVEEWVQGEPLMTSERLAEHATWLLEGLGRVHEGYGVSGRPVTELWGVGFGDQWQRVREADLVPDHVGAAVAELIAADRRVRMSWAHGDLVASNVMSTPDGPKVIDWEHAGERPVMHDAAKLHLFAADKHLLLPLLLAEWGHQPASDGYTAAEELALVHAKFLVRAPVRMAELAGHRRSGVYASQVTTQAGLLEDVLENVG
ncbi:phosphotransferase [Ornithinimicrobium cryptoxanthini]|uniref:phosphotransferase n=1 Tax=Ornithinimicrobium cryptoxanthini TaxID=2934161 RepID=UPI0021191063|nr:phosphotransferase [Ornithinimicrobium cryptoxanthini]